MIKTKLIWAHAVAGVLAAGSCMSAVAACSGSNGPNFGPMCASGTVLANGECVLAPSDASSPAEDAGAPRQDEASVGRDGAPPPPSDAAAVDADAQASGGDPCPPYVIDANCSSACGGPNADCEQVRCQMTDAASVAPPVHLTSWSQLPFTMRTPDHPGVDPECDQTCTSIFGQRGTAVDYGMAVWIDMPYPNYGIRVFVDPPWQMLPFDGRIPWCASNPAAANSYCMYERNADLQLLVFTEDPNAPSRNVRIEAAPADQQQCP